MSLFIYGNIARFMTQSMGTLGRSVVRGYEWFFSPSASNAIHSSEAAWVHSIVSRTRLHIVNIGSRPVGEAILV